MITDRDLCCSVIAEGMDPKTTQVEKLITLATGVSRRRKYRDLRAPDAGAPGKKNSHRGCRGLRHRSQADLALKDKPERVSKTVAEISKASRPFIAA